MNLQQAIEVAADWWVSMIYDGVWNNGDSTSEAFHSAFKSLTAPLKLEDRPKIREGFLELLKEERHQYCLYSDYGNAYIENMYQNLGLPYNTSFHCPQKAGTKILRDPIEGYAVVAKSGYRQNWEEVKVKGGADENQGTQAG